MIGIKNISNQMPKLLFSDTKPRPSKSVITPKLYTQKNTEVPFDVYSKLLDYQIDEVTGYYLRGTDKKIDSYTLTTDFSSILDAVNIEPGTIFYKLDDLHSFVNIEFIVLIAGMYEETTVYFSKFDYSVFVFCQNKTGSVSKICIPDNKYVKSFSILVPEEIQKDVKRINDIVFTNDIRVNNYILNNLSLEKISIIKSDISIITDYYLSYINKIDNNSNCNCKDVFRSEILNCKICKNCLSLYSTFFSPLDAFPSAQEAAAILKASL